MADESRTLEELEARRDEIKERMLAIDSEHSDRDLTPDARTEYDALREELTEVEPPISRIQLRREQVAELAGDPNHVEDERTVKQFQTKRPDAVRTEEVYDLTSLRGGSPEAMRAELNDRAKRAIDMATFPEEVTRNGDDVPAHVTDLLGRVGHEDPWGTFARRVVNTGSPIYQRAFAKELAGAGKTADEERALSLTAEFGGVAVPFVLDPTVVPLSNGVVNPIRMISRVIPITVDTWKGVTSAGTTAAYSAEAAETEEAELKFVQPEVSTERASTLILASFEITADWNGIQGEVARLIGEAKDTLEATKFLEGSGTNEPFGFMTGATETVLTKEKEKFLVGDVYELKRKIAPRWENTGTFVANGGIYDLIRQFDTAGGANMWVQIGYDQPPQLLGRPAVTLSTMNAEIKENKLHMTYGDFSNYVIVERLGMSIEVIPHVMNGKKATGQRGFYAFWRNGAKVLSKLPFKTLKGHT